MAFIIIDLEFNNLSGIHKCIPNVYNDYPNLKKASYREKAAKALYDGVEKIFKKYPAK